LFSAGGPISVVSTRLAPEIELHVPLVIGREAAVFIDSGVARLGPELAAHAAARGVGPAASPGGGVVLRAVVHTHSHHDHIGSNGQILRAFPGCRVLGPGLYASWHEDFERHLLEFARSEPQLVPDTPELRDEVLGLLDEPVRLHGSLSEGDLLDLGGGVVLEAISVPGHMLAELAYLERSTGTLLLGDAITGLDWPIIHSHLSVPDYRATLSKLERLLGSGRVSGVQAAHFGALSVDETAALCGRARLYISELEQAVLARVAQAAALGDVWASVCDDLGKVREFRALNTVRAHLSDLEARRMVGRLRNGRWQRVGQEAGDDES